MLDPQWFSGYLSKEKANEVFLDLEESLRKLGKTPADFEWESPSGFVISLRYPGTEYEFTLEVNDIRVDDCKYSGGYSPRYSADGRVREQWEKYRLADWEDRLHDALRTWIDNVERDQTTPNLWETLAHEKSLFQEANVVQDQSPFSPEEQKAVSRLTIELKEYFKTTQKLRAEQMKLVVDRLSYLEDAATRLGRI